jgi:hypothetical protein
MVETAPGHVREARRLVIDVLTPEQVSQLEEISRAVLAQVGPVQLTQLRALIASGRLS